MRAFLYKGIGLELTLNSLPSLCPYSYFLSLFLLFFNILLSRLIATYLLSCFTNPLADSFIVVLIVFPSLLFLRFFHAHISSVSFLICLPHLPTQFLLLFHARISPLYFNICPYVLVFTLVFSFFIAYDDSGWSRKVLYRSCNVIN